MEAVKHVHVRLLVLAVAVGALAALVSGAPAYGGCGKTSKDPPSSVEQYVEQVPTSCGNQATNTGDGERKIPKKLETQIEQQGGSDVEALKNVVSKESYGADVTTKIKTKSQKKKKTTKKLAPKTRRILTDSETRNANPVSASFGVVTGGSDARLLGLLIVMVGIAAIVVVTSFRRRRIGR